jgi:hypothetical protein
MAKATFQVDTYQYYDWASRDTGKSNLILQGAGGQACTVWFEENPATALPAAFQITPGRFWFYYHHHQLDHLIDMLRNEKPIFVFFDDDYGLANSRISTTDEPIGEGELPLDAESVTRA